MNYRRHCTALFILLMLLQHSVTAQQDISLIDADSSWGKEVFQFPLSFAPQLKYKGVEEARFPKDWARKDSVMFWSYAFAWQLQTTHALSKAELENNLRFYFDGLMSAVSQLPEGKLPATSVLLQQQAQTNSYLKGTVTIYDAFTLKAPLLLHLTIEQQFCTKSKTALLLFRFSPKPPEHFVWQQLNTMKIPDAVLKKKLCP